MLNGIRDGNSSWCFCVWWGWLWEVRLSFGWLCPSPGMLPRSSEQPLALNTVSHLSFFSSANSLCNSYSKLLSAWRSQSLRATPFLPWIFQCFPPSFGLCALLLVLNARSVIMCRRNCQCSTRTCQGTHLAELLIPWIWSIFPANKGTSVYVFWVSFWSLSSASKEKKI